MNVRTGPAPVRRGRLQTLLILAAVALPGVVGASAAIALAAPSATDPFRLVFEGRHDAVPVSADFPFGLRHSGTFTSTSGFCPSGTAVDLQVTAAAGLPDRAVRRYTCGDGSGTLTVSVGTVVAEHQPPYSATWSVIEGTGAYAGFRGRGGYNGEFLSGDPLDQTSVFFRSMFQGFADADAVAPAIGVTNARATKLRRPRGAYSLRLVLSLRDDVQDNPVGYSVTVSGGGSELAGRTGSTSSGNASLTLRIRPFPGVRSVRVRVAASDPVGNAAVLTRAVRLPR